MSIEVRLLFCVKTIKIHGLNMHPFGIDVISCVPTLEWTMLACNKLRPLFPIHSIQNMFTLLHP